MAHSCNINRRYFLSSYLLLIILQTTFSNPVAQSDSSVSVTPSPNAPKKLILIPIDNYKVLNYSANTAKLEDIKKLFDGKIDTRADIHTSSLEVVVDLGIEYEIENVLLFSDLETLSVNLVVGVQSKPLVGQSGYNCKKHEKGFLCSADCGYTVMARFLYFTIEQSMGWFNAYEFQVNGYKVSDFSKSERQSSDDLVYRRPIWPLDCSANAATIVGGSGDGVATIGTTPISVLFGGQYSVQKITIAADTDVPVIVQVIDDNRLSQNLTMDLASYCKKNSTTNLFDCKVDEISDFTTSSVTIYAKDLITLQIYGIPIYYPWVESKLRIKKGKISLRFQENKCNSLVYSNCDRAGIDYKCEDLQIIRLPGIGLASSTPTTLSLDPMLDKLTILMTKSKVVPWAKGIELQDVQDGLVELLLPQSYEYLGQYQCQCVLNDPSKKKVKSLPLTITADHITNGLAENVTYLMEPNIVNAVQSVVQGNLILLPDVAMASFNFEASYFTVWSKTTISFHFRDEKNMTNVTNPIKGGSCSDELVPAIPNAQESWRVRISRCTARISPDAKDNDTFNAAWAIKSYPDRIIRDTFRVLYLKPEHVEKVYGWLWKRTNEIIEFRVYTRNTWINSPEIELVVDGCAPGDGIAMKLIISGSKCTSILNATCVQVSEGNLATVRLPSRFDNGYTLSISSPIPQRKILAVAEKVKSNDMKNLLKDVTLVSSVIGLDSTNKEMVVKIQLKNKAITDFITCGNVKMTIYLQNDKTMAQILQQDWMEVTIIPGSEATYEFSVKVALDNMNLESEYVPINVTNPYVVKVPKVTLAVEKRIALSWSQIPEDIWPIVSSFRVNVVGVVQACGTDYKRYSDTVVKSDVYFPNKITNFRPLPFPKNKIVDHEISVSLLFNDTGSSDQFAGEYVVQKVTTGMQGQTNITISLMGQRSPTSQIFRVLPGQSIDCSYDAKLVVNPVLKIPNSAKSSLVAGQRNLFKVENLTPGRRYTIKATVKYNSGKGEDKESKEIYFSTIDDVSVPKGPFILDLDSPFKAKCTATVGSKPNAKTLEWRMEDRTDLPNHMTYSRGDTENSVVLNAKRILQHHQGVYRCFVSPEVADTPPAILKIYVNSVTLDKALTITPYDSDVNATCSAPLGRPLAWYRVDKSGALGEKVKADKVVKQEDTEYPSRQILMLVIKKADFADTGVYRCMQEIEGFGLYGKAFNLTLVERAIVDAAITKSTYIGSTRSMVCKGRLAHQNQTPRWQNVDDVEGIRHTKNSLSHEIKITNRLDIPSKFTCKIVPATPTGNATGTIHVDHIIEAGVWVPNEKVIGEIDSPFEVTCKGFANAVQQHVRWIKVGDGMTTPTPLMTTEEAESAGNSSKSLEAPQGKKKKLETTRPYKEINVSGGSSLSKETPEESTLKFDKLDYSDSGKYACQLMTKDGLIVKETVLTLNVVKKEEPDTTTTETTTTIITTVEPKYTEAVDKTTVLKNEIKKTVVKPMRPSESRGGTATVLPRPSCFFLIGLATLLYTLIGRH